MVAGIGGLYQLTQLNPDFHILADSGFCDVDGILKTTEKFLTQIEEEYSLNWTQVEIKARTKQLAEISYDELWSNR